MGEVSYLNMTLANVYTRCKNLSFNNEFKLAKRSFFEKEYAKRIWITVYSINVTSCFLNSNIIIFGENDHQITFPRSLNPLEQALTPKDIHVQVALNGFAQDYYVLPSHFIPILGYYFIILRHVYIDVIKGSCTAGDVARSPQSKNSFDSLSIINWIQRKDRHRPSENVWYRSNYPHCPFVPCCDVLGGFYDKIDSLKQRRSSRKQNIYSVLLFSARSQRINGRVFTDVSIYRAF